MRTKHTTFFNLCSWKFLSFSHDLTLPIVGSTFQLTGRHVRRDICSFPGSSTSGSKAYFLFKLHDPTSGELGRQQQLTTRLSSCILDMCGRGEGRGDSQRQGLLRLLYKKDDRRLVKNWRPISLLNTDYKLASKVITERLKRVMQSIVHKDQTCGVVGRSIFSNLQD